MFFFLLFLRLLQMGLFKIVWLFHDGFCAKQQHFTLSSAPAYRFSQLKSHEVVWTSQWRTMASFVMPFSSFVYMCTNHLATKQLLFNIAELEIRLCVWRQGESWSSIVDSVFEQCPSIVLQPILHTFTDACTQPSNMLQVSYLMFWTIFALTVQRTVETIRCSCGTCDT